MEFLELYEYLLKLQSIARIGITYSTDEYALDNYHQVNDLTLEMLEKLQNQKIDGGNIFEEKIYPTPNVSCRAVIINDKNEILLVREKNSGLYSMPGGWCDIFDSPKEAIIKECEQEAGAKVSVVRLIGVVHKIPSKSYMSKPIYELVFECKVEGELTIHEYETDDVNYFPISHLPNMSRKMTMDEIHRAIDAQQNKQFILD